MKTRRDFLRAAGFSAAGFFLAAGNGTFAQTAATNGTPAKAADTPEMKAILKQADESRGNVKGVKWFIEIDAVENGERQLRSANVSARGYDFLAEFLTPPKVKGQRALFVERNMWFTKPGVKKPVPTSSRQKLVGGAAYGDIAATNYAEDYTPVSVADDTVDGIACLLFDLKAANKQTTYDRVRYWVSKERTIAVMAEYYTVSGKMFKTARFEFDHKVQIDGKERPFISKIIISDAIVKENVTSMIFGMPTLVDLPDSTFDVNLMMTR